MWGRFRRQKCDFNSDSDIDINDYAINNFSCNKWDVLYYFMWKYFTNLYV